MKKLLIFVLAIAGVVSLNTACSDKDDVNIDEVLAWREANNDWLAEMEARTNPDGTPYYEKITPEWNKSSYVLMHWFNERSDNPELLTPIYTSTVDVRYNLYLYNDVRCDSSTSMTTPAPGVYRARLNKLIAGWAASVTRMHVGDTCEVIIPYAMGYANYPQGVIPAYSNLRFNIRLADIYLYEKSPEDSDDNKNTGDDYYYNNYLNYYYNSLYSGYYY